MQTRNRLTGAVAALIAATLSVGVAQAQKTVKIGASAPKTGPLAVGASITHWPNVKLWVETVNARGGLKLKDGQRKIELVEYDDRTTPGEAIKNVTRLATQDKADFILAPYGTGFNLATAAIFAKFGYPMVTSTSITDKQEELVKRYPGIFFTLGSTSAFSEGVADVLKKMRDDGKIGNRVAMVNVADAFGIELANAARPVFKAAGFEIVYDKSYPLGTQDLSPVIRGAKAATPDAFVAWSYPPDTFGLTAQAKVQGLDTKAFYTAVATAFPAFVGKFGAAVEGILGGGGIYVDSPEMKAYFAAHKKITGKSPDYWASPVVYATYQVLEQAIEGVGELDREKVTEYIKTNKFKTVVGEMDLSTGISNKFWTVGQWQGGKFHGVNSLNIPGAKPVKEKPAWK